MSKPTLYGFLNGKSTPKGDRRRLILAYARALKVEREDRKRSGSVQGDQNPPPSERTGGALADYYRGVIAAAERVSAEVTAILRDARLGMEAGRELPAPSPYDHLTPDERRALAERALQAAALADRARAAMREQEADADAGRRRRRA